MSPYFLAIIIMVATSLLVALAAMARFVWLRLRPTKSMSPGTMQSTKYTNTSDTLLLIAVAMSWYSVAAGWAGQLVCYPLYLDMSAYGSEAFHVYSHGYLSRWASGTWPVGVMCLTWAILLWLPVKNVPKRLIVFLVILCIGFAAVTPFAANAQDNMFAEGFSKDQYSRLMFSNGIRTAIFTLIGVLAFIVMRRRILYTESGRTT